MYSKKITASVLSVATGAVLLAGIAILPAHAQNVTAGVNASVTASGTGVKVNANVQARLSKIITRSDTAIANRITALNNLNARVQTMKNVSVSEKTTLSNDVQTNISGLTTLKAKIDADTDATTALTDEKTITANYRIYALVVPQGYILASSDRVQTIVGLMTTLSTKLQARISADQTAGKNVTALQTSLADLNAKIADANTQAQTAQSAVVSLSPDQGNASVAASNKTVLVGARADIKTATADLVSARQDAKTIVAGLKSLGGSASVSASASTTTQ